MTAGAAELKQRVADSVETPSGKWRGAENFPVGSLLIRRELRAHVHAFIGSHETRTTSPTTQG
jgi:hypothetical protein